MTIQEAYEKWKHEDEGLCDKVDETWRDPIVFDLWQAVKAHVAAQPDDELSKLREQLEWIRTWTPVSCRACPLCAYHQGKLMVLCEWHQEVEAVKAEATTGGDVYVECDAWKKRNDLLEELYHRTLDQREQWQAEAEHLAKRSTELLDQLDRIRSWTPVSAHACPLCIYQNGKLLKLCEWHNEARISGELRAHVTQEALQSTKAEATKETIDCYGEFLAWRGIDPKEVCPACSGAGSRAYANTTAWRGGIGGQTVTGGICDHCWGSGNAVHPWTNLRRLEAQCPPTT